MAEDVEVEIFGQTFRVAAGTATPDYIHRLAAYVDERMQAIAQTATSPSFNRMAVLTALNIADDLLKLQDQHDQSTQLLHDKTEHLLSLLQQQVTDD
jgi:cell division protein ZapA